MSSKERLVKEDLQLLNELYTPLSPLARLEKLFADFEHKDILVTSSFGSTSGILLGMISRVAPGHPVHFIDTTYCFKKTIAYKNALTRLLELNIIDVLPDVKENQITQKSEMWLSNKDRCCYLNKIKPFEKYKVDKKIWVSGLLMNTTPFRRNLKIFEKRDSIIKMHPNIDTKAEEFKNFLIDNFIPPHPLTSEGYESIGCTHCTVSGTGRSGRWKDSTKTECGLHT